MRISIGTTTGFHLRRLALALKDEDFDVQYFSAAPLFQTKAQGLNRVSNYSAFFPLFPLSALSLIRQLPSSVKTDLVNRRLGRMDEYIEKYLQPCDLFIGLSGMSIRSAKKARQLGAIVIIDRGARHVQSQQDLIMEREGAGLSPYYVSRELSSYNEADYIVVPSLHAKSSFVDKGFDPSRIFACPLGVDLELFRPSPRPAGNLKILFIGGWSFQKGVDLLVAALAQNPAWHLTHIGTLAGAPFPRGHPQFTSLGHLDHTQMAREMANHHILVLPSRQDGFGMVLLEALASGLPIVSSEFTGGPDIREMVENPSWIEIVKPGDLADLVRGISAMEVRERLGGQSRIRLTPADRQRLSWRSYGKRYSAFIRSKSTNLTS